MSQSKIETTNIELVEQLATTLNKAPQGKQTLWYYTNNSDGSIRWMWPSTNKTPIVLSLYAKLNTKAKLVSKLVNLAFRLKQPHLIANGSMELSLLESNLKKWHKAMGTSELAIFTGTVGINRKAVLAFGSATKTEWFVKLPLGLNSAKLIQKEDLMLHNLQCFNFKNTQIPAILHLNDNYFAQQALDYTAQPKQLNAIHWSAFQEWKTETAKVEVLGKSAFWISLEAQFRKLILIKAHLKFPKHYELLRNIANGLDKNIEIYTGLSHQDFTPWNSGIEDNLLKVWDWELANLTSPIGMDALHFVMQGEAMLNNASFKSIENCWQQIYVQLSNLLTGCPNHLENLKALYLLSQVSTYLELYHKQEELHTQALHILEVWEQALTVEAEKLRPIKQRTHWINAFFEWLPNRVQYAWLKPTTEHPSLISDYADIDLALGISSLPAVLRFIKEHKMVKSVKQISFSDRTAINLMFTDGSRLNLDLLTAFRYKGQTYLSIEDLLNNSVTNSAAIKVASPVYDWAYKSAFYSLNNAAIPARHCTWLQLPEAEQTLLVSEAGRLLNFNFTNIEEITSPKTLVKAWNSAVRKSRNPLTNLKAKARYFSDIVKQIIKPRGAIITLSGVDGAGKSTILELIEKQLENWRYPVVRLRHRPSLVPILSSFKYGKEGAEQRAASSLPRQGKNNNQLLSIIRFSYYLLDYIIGQWYIKLRYVSQGKLVIYDRYYFDFMADPRRSNLNLPAWLTKLCWKFIQTPDLNILLLADPEIIIKRKQELSLETIGLLNKKYGNTFACLANKNPNAYLQINNTNINHTLATITHTLESRLGL